MDYNQLTAAQSTAGSIANWLSSSQLVNAAPEIVLEAESSVYRRLRHWRMVKTVSNLTLTIGSNILALPSDYLEVKSLYITGTNYAKLTMKPEEEVIASYCYDGSGTLVNQQPMIFYVDQTNFNFDSPSDQTYPTALTYYQQPAALVTSITNFLTTAYPRMFRCACMIGAAEFMKDVGQGQYDRSYWVGEFEKELLVAQVESDRQARATEAGQILI